MITVSSHSQSISAGVRSRAAALATVVVTGPLFLAIAAFLSLVERDALGPWGWKALDHHGVPWPSALELTSFGWLQSVAFALTGLAVVALANRLRGLLQGRRARSAAVAGLAVAGAGLVAAALPLDHPSGDPAQLGSWVGSWHAGVHVTGFVAAALGSLVAVVATALASRRTSPKLARASGVVAAVSLATLALPGAIGWYAFLTAFFGWTAALAVQTSER